MRDFLDNLEKCQQYINSLEEERKKIQVFQRELPLCFELVTQAIEACKQQLCGTTTTTTTLTTECLNGHHSECSEKTSSDGPILEEFMPLKTCYSSDDEHESESHKPLINKSGKKSDWLRSVQLWNQSPDPPTSQQENQPKKVTVVEVKRNGNGGAFHPFQKNSNNANENNDININNDNNKQPISTPAGSACSSAQDADMMPSSNGGSKKEKDGQGVRKARRCWSAELHRKFVHALQQLGGSHATPKQIREMMKVDGLTNDEVKSHLQKYRLHTRRPSSTVPNNTNSQAPQFVVVGGIWVPPPTTTAGDTTATITTPSNIYAPIATMATPPSTMHQSSAHKQASHSICEERAASHSDGGAHSNSPATSSSTHTTTASHSH
ncbi:transcription factor HHO2-like isoform X2 [Amaranthus tricolor]|uniref:transcription factor HHO2-like isoform X2 n=1 Tax=Amaranthus tricolor TaxID=29722 RepID=UPI0025857C51|nr:transcription factor HHO2-like isoform X2 [Amaranthus tricolor]